jgi:hypothetical protein
VRRRHFAIPLILGIFLLGSILLAGLLERRGARAAVRDDWLFLPKSAQLKPMLLGFHGVAADLVWIQVVQYVGTHWLTDRKFPQLSEALELVTSLDPHFIEPYRLGGVYLIYLSRQPEAAVSLLEKGAVANPGRWELPHDLGRYYFLEARDDARALRWWELSATLPDRPDYLPRFVARLYAKTGREETALELWLNLYKTAQNDHVRSLALQEIERLKAVNSPRR